MSKSTTKKKLGILVLLKISVTRAKCPENTGEKAVFRACLCHTSYPAWKKSIKTYFLNTKMYSCLNKYKLFFNAL